MKSCPWVWAARWRSTVENAATTSRTPRSWIRRILDLRGPIERSGAERDAQSTRCQLLPPDFNLATSASSWRQRGRRHLCRVSLREVSILRGAPLQLPSGSPWAAGHARTGGEASHADGGPGEAIRPLLALGVGGVPARQSGDRARSLA